MPEVVAEIVKGLHRPEGMKKPSPIALSGLEMAVPEITYSIPPLVPSKFIPAIQDTEWRRRFRFQHSQPLRSTFRRLAQSPKDLFGR